MAWTADWPLTSTGGQDFTDPAIIGQLILAGRERQGVIGGGLWPKPLAGAEINFETSAITTTHFALGSIVAAIESAITTYPCPWVRKATAGYYDGASDIETFTLDTFRADAKVNPAGFYRLYPHPDTGVPTVAYGIPQDGDYLTPRFLNELRACFNLMVATLGGDTTYDDMIAKSASGADAIWADAKTAGETDWDAGGSGGWMAGLPELAASWGTGAYNAFMERHKNKSHVNILNDALACAVDWYVLATVIPGQGSPTVFDAYGDPVANETYRNWLTDAFAANSGATRWSSTYLGNTTDKPNNPWCDAPASPTYAGYRGWRRVGPYEGGKFAVVRWNVPGGFVYVE